MECVEGHSSQAAFMKKLVGRDDGYYYGVRGLEYVGGMMCRGCLKDMAAWCFRFKNA